MRARTLGTAVACAALVALAAFAYVALAARMYARPLDALREPPWVALGAGELRDRVCGGDARRPGLVAPAGNAPGSAQAALAWLRAAAAPALLAGGAPPAPAAPPPGPHVVRAKFAAVAAGARAARLRLAASPAAAALAAAAPRGLAPLRAEPAQHALLELPPGWAALVPGGWVLAAEPGSEPELVQTLDDLASAAAFGAGLA